MQALFFVAFLVRPSPGITGAVPGPFGSSLRVLTPDTFRYETPGINLAEGGTLSLPVSDTRDEVVFGWVCTRHPEACLADGTHPTTLYPPGYSLFIAAVYFVVGRAPAALVALQFLMLLAMFAFFERIAARLLDHRGYAFAMAVAATYPFLAMYATMLSSDFLHIFLYFAAVATLHLMRPGVCRGALFGVLFAFATLVRPYSLVVFPALWLWTPVWRAAGATWKERFISGVAFGLPLLAWVLRNAYWFGRFLPMTTLGPGLVLMHMTLAWDTSAYSARAGDVYYAELAQVAKSGDVSTVEASERLSELAKQRIKEHPEKLAVSVLTNVPKLWVSLGSSRDGLSPAWPLLVTWLGGLLVLGVAGLWLSRRDERWHLLALSICVYWGFLLYSTGEARRTSPLRLPMVLAAGVAVSKLAERLPRKKA